MRNGTVELIVQVVVISGAHRIEKLEVPKVLGTFLSEQIPTNQNIKAAAENAIPLQYGRCAGQIKMQQQYLILMEGMAFGRHVHQHEKYDRKSLKLLYYIKETNRPCRIVSVPK